jgi:colicin import membrane protein
LSGGRFVDAIKNKENAVNEQMESKLLEAEKHFENLEKERVSKINNERIELVRPYLEEVDNLFLADMEEDVFDAYLLTKKQNHEAILKAEQEREAKRIAEEKAEAERLEAQRLENIKLKAEAEAKEKALEKERAEAKAKQDAIELKAKKERESIQAKADAERKAQAEKEAKLKAELKAKEDAEIKRIAENNARIIAEKKAEDERLQAELSKEDGDKFQDLLNDLEALKTKYEFKSAKNKKMYADTCFLIDKVINHIKI